MLQKDTVLYAYATSGHCHLSCNFVKTSKDDEAKLMVHADFCSKATVVDVDFFSYVSGQVKSKRGPLCASFVQKVTSLSCAQLRGARFSFICCCMPLHVWEGDSLFPRFHFLARLSQLHLMKTLLSRARPTDDGSVACMGHCDIYCCCLPLMQLSQCFLANSFAKNKG